jgi:xylan 1,4-beta-xylosidase
MGDYTMQLHGASRQILLAVIIVGVVFLNGMAQNAQNPVLWADVPDPSMIRVGDTYYMVSTTMHLSPGIPIMKSTNLVNWTIVNYAYDRLVENNPMNLNNGESAYGRGSWASSINYKDGVFYIHSFSYTSGRSHIYKTTDIENGEFTAHTLSSLSHDASLFFDDDGKVYLAYGHDDIELRELNSDMTNYQSGGVRQIIINNASGVAGSDMILTAEGTQMFKINGYYYVMNICWPRGGGRTVVIHRSRNITGPYEGRVALNDQGIAQGGLISTPQGDWYSYLFKDNGAVGRIPYLVPVSWQDDWPIFGNAGKVPSEIAITLEGDKHQGIVASDDFESLHTKNHGLKLEWQWNHNPVHAYWSLTDRPGYLRIINGRIDTDFESTPNTLTQRSIGPACTATVAIELDNMKDGDVAGLGALQYEYGYVGVKMDGTSKAIVMVNADNNNPVQMAAIPLQQNHIYLQVRMDFVNRADKATFYYSLDGTSWEPIGNTLQMSYSLEHFMGYRFALFNYATKQTGGYVDFDSYRVNSYPFGEPPPPVVHEIPGTIEAEDYYEMNGIQKEADEQGVMNIGYINDGDGAKYKVNVLEDGLYTVKFRVATAAELDNTIGIMQGQTVLGSLQVQAALSNGWHDWYLDSITVQLEAGEQDLALQFTGESDYLFNVDWFDIYTTETIVANDWGHPHSKGQLFSGTDHAGYRLHISNSQGTVLQSRAMESSHFDSTLEGLPLLPLLPLLSLPPLAPGVYYVVITKQNGVMSAKGMIVQ